MPGPQGPQYETEGPQTYGLNAPQGPHGAPAKAEPGQNGTGFGQYPPLQGPHGLHAR